MSCHWQASSGSNYQTNLLFKRSGVLSGYIRHLYVKTSQIPLRPRCGCPTLLKLDSQVMIQDTSLISAQLLTQMHPCYSELQSQTLELSAPNAGNPFWVWSSPVSEACLAEPSWKDPGQVWILLKLWNTSEKYLSFLRLQLYSSLNKRTTFCDVRES